MNQQDNEPLGVIRGISNIARCLGVTIPEARKLIKFGHMPGEQLGANLASYVVLRSELKKFFENLGKGDSATRKAIGVTQKEAKGLRRNLINGEIEAQMAKLLDGVELVPPTPAPAPAEEHAEAAE